MSVEIDIAGLRADHDWIMKGPAVIDEPRRNATWNIVTALPALLDEIEALRECYAHAQTTMEFEIGLKRRAETAETELSALKARVAELEELCNQSEADALRYATETDEIKTQLETRTKERNIAMDQLAEWAFKAGGYEAKLDRLTAWCETEGKYGDRVLAVLDGKEG